MITNQVLTLTFEDGQKLSIEQVPRPDEPHVCQYSCSTCRAFSVEIRGADSAEQAAEKIARYNLHSEQCEA